MSKREARELLKRNCTEAGDFQKELFEMERVQSQTSPEELATLTAGCTGMFTLVCC